MVMYGERFVYGNVTLTDRQRRLVEVRQAAARRERERARHWAATGAGDVAALNLPVPQQREDDDRTPLPPQGQETAPADVRGSVQGVSVTPLHWPLLLPETQQQEADRPPLPPQGQETAPAEERGSVQGVSVTLHWPLLLPDTHQKEDDRPLLPQQGQETATARHRGSVQGVSVTPLHWPLQLLPETDGALHLMPRTRGEGVIVRGVLVPYPQGARPTWRLAGVGQYLERSMSLLRFYEFATRRREAAARRGAFSLAELRALDEQLRQRDARRRAVDAAWLALGVVRGALQAVSFLCSDTFPPGQDVEVFI